MIEFIADGGQRVFLRPEFIVQVCQRPREDTQEMTWFVHLYNGMAWTVTEEIALEVVERIRLGPIHGGDEWKLGKTGNEP